VAAEAELPAVPPIICESRVVVVRASGEISIVDPVVGRRAV